MVSVAGYRSHGGGLEWCCLQGLRALGSALLGVVVIVDVLSFSTGVAVAAESCNTLSRGLDGISGGGHSGR
jgi:hypothetical protein